MFKQKSKTPNTIRRVLLLAILTVVMVASFSVFFGRSNRAAAATSSTINFQARLLTAAGNVVPDGQYNVEFKLYNAVTSSGSSQGSCTGDAACVWVESRTAANRVRVVNGYLTVNLGSVTAFGSINWDQELWLGMNIGGTTGPSWDGEMSPRLKLTAVPYAFTAGKLVGGSGANTTTLNTGTPSGTNTISLPTESGTLCIQSSVNCGFALSSGSGNYIQNTTSLQNANFYVRAASSGSVAGVLQANASGAGDILDLRNGAGTLVASFSSTGAMFLQPSADTTSVFNLKTSTGNNMFTIDSLNSRVGIGLGSTNLPSLNAGGLQINGALKLSGGATQQDLYVTPNGGTVSSMINVVNFDPGAFGQIIAMGLPSTANATSRAISLLDARTVSHQPTIAVFSPDQNQLVGFSWEGSNTDSYIKSSSSGNIYLQANGVNAFSASATAVQVGNTTANTAIALDSGTSAINIGTGGQARTTNIATGAAAQTVTLGSTNSSSSLTLNSGTGTINIGTSSSARSVNLGTGAAAQTVAVGSTSGASSLTLNAGTGTIGIGTSASARTVNIATGAAAQTVTVGSTNGASSLVLQSGTGNVTVKPASSNAAFQVQDAAGLALLNVDSANGWIINNGSTHPGNVLENPSFEANGSFTASGWNYSGQGSINASASAHHGNNEFSYTPNSTLLILSSFKYLEVQPGDQYYAELWYRAAAGTTGGATGASFSFTFYDKAKASLGSFGVVNMNAANTSNTLVTTSATAPAGAAYVRLTTAVNTTSTSGTWFFDDYYMTRSNQQSPYLYKNSVDSLTAFQVQNAAGASVLDVDTTNQRIGIGTATPGYKLDVAGDVNISTGSAYKINGTNICTSSGCTASSASAILNQNASTQSAVFKIQAASDVVTATILANGSQNADVFEIQSSSASPVAGIRPSGAIWSAPIVNPVTDVPSTARLFIQANASSSNAAVFRASALGTGVSSDGSILRLQNKDGTADTFSVGGDGAITSKTLTNSTAALSIQNSVGGPALNVDNTNANLISNPNMEGGTTGWAVKGASAISQQTTYAYDGNNSLRVITTAAANDGTKFNYSLLASTQYTFSVFVRSSADFSTLQIGYSSDGTNDTSCATAQTAKNANWMRLTCTFTTGAVSGTRYVYVKQTDAAIHTFYIDGAQLETAASASLYRDGKIAVGGSLLINGGQASASAATAALQVNALQGGSGLKVYGSGDNNIFQDAMNVYTADGSTALFSISDSIRVTSVVGGNSFFNTPALKVVTNDTGASAIDLFGASGQTGDILRLYNNTTSNTKMFSIAAAGAATFQNATDSDAAFLVNNAAGSSVLRVDTSNQKVAIGLSSGTIPAKLYVTTSNTVSLRARQNGSSDILQLANGTADVLTVANGGSSTFKTTTDSTTAFQIQDSTSSNIFQVDTVNNRVGVNLQTASAAVSLDVEGGIQQSGLSTSNTSSTDANKWTKLGSCTITAQFQDCLTTLNLLGGSNGNSAGNGQATISARVKQQAALASAPIINLTFNDTAEVITKDDVKLVTTTNSGSQTVVELWIRITNTFENYQYTPVMNAGWNNNNQSATWVWTPLNGFSASLPAGTQTSAVYGDSVANTMTIQSSTNVSNALQVKNSAANSIFSVDTAANQINVGSTAQSAQLNMTGEISWGASLDTPQGFEGATFVPTSPGTWSTGGNVNWSRVTSQSQSGAASAAAGTIADSQTSWLDLNYTFTVDGTFSFYWKVSSESGWDFLNFCYDNDSCTRTSGFDQQISGEVGWVKVSKTVTAGAHSFRWLYAKDGGAVSGSDKGWIDNVQFNGGGSAGVLRGGTLSFIASDTISFQTTNNANALTVDSNGRVGINTTTPTEALTVVGNFNVADATTPTKAYRFRTSGGSLDFEGGGANLYLSAWTNADFTGTQYTALILYNSQSRMDVKSAYTYFVPTADSTSTIDVDTPGTGLQNLIRFAQTGTVQGSITVNGATVAYNAFTGSHYAWTDVPIDRGKVVSMTGDNKRRDMSDFTSEPFYGIAETAQANDPRVLGAYFGRGAGDWTFDNPDQVMSVGNGDMWVDDEGGDIQPGDYLVSSNLKGYAMKDTGQFAESYIIARASDDVNWSHETAIINGHKVKKISVLFTQFSRLNAAGLAMGLTSGGLVSNDVTFNGLAFFNKAVHFKDDATFDGLIKVSDNTAGTVKILAGQTSAAVTFNKAYGKPPKVTTGISEFVDVIVDNKTVNGFTVRIPSPRSGDTYVDWTAFETP